jgi:hypothetical protein
VKNETVAELTMNKHVSILITTLTLHLEGWRGGESLDLYSGSSRFVSLGFIRSLQTKAKIKPRLSPDHLLQITFHFIIHQSFYYSTCPGY